MIELIESADVIFGLALGDEGKGQTVCATANKRYKQTGKIPAVVRYSGGCQNAHNVVWKLESEFGQEYHHEHSQIGAMGLLAFKGKTFTWKTVPFDLHAFVSEAITLYNLQTETSWISHVVSLEDILRNQYIHEDCLWVAPIHAYVSKLREMQIKHGSTGQGIFEVNKFAELFPDKALRLRDALTLLTSQREDEIGRVREKIKAFSKWVLKGMEQAEGNHTLKEKTDKVNLLSDNLIDTFISSMGTWMSQRLDANEISAIINSIVSENVILEEMKNQAHLVFEGGQGVLLDMEFGFFPNVTFSHAIPITAQDLIHRLRISDNKVKFIGVSRYYGTRHGAGYLPNEYKDHTNECKYLTEFEQHNNLNFQGKMRFGCLTADTLIYALQSVKNYGISIDHIHWTHADIDWAQREQSKLLNPELAIEASNSAYNNILSNKSRRPIINNWIKGLETNIGKGKYSTEPFDMIHQLSGITGRSEGSRVEIFTNDKFLIKGA